MTTEITNEQLLELLCKACPHGHPPAEAATWLVEKIVADKINTKFGTDYEPAANCRHKGVDLLSVSKKFKPVQNKHAKGDRQEGKGKRREIIRKALIAAKEEGFDSAELATYQVKDGKVVKLVLGDITQLGGGDEQELAKAGWSWKQLFKWGFREVHCDT